jgi:hypothetical protein
MKKLLILAMAVLLLTCIYNAHAQVVLPKDIVIKVPSPELPKEIAVFSGKWRGTWSGGGVDFILVVTEIDLEKAEIIYANSEGRAVSAAYDCLTAKVIPGNNPKIQFDRTVRFKSSGGVWEGKFQYSFEMQKDLKTIKGTVETQRSTSKATLEKIEQ